MESYKEKYERIKDEFETYQNFAESQIQILNEKNIKLEKNLDALSNIVEVSKYINTYLSNDNLVTVINDMIIGILGVTYSSIYLRENDDLIIKATNIYYDSVLEIENEYLRKIGNGKPFILNCKEPLLAKISNKETIHSIIGVPIQIRERFMGYIIVEHSLWNFFNYDHIKFISSIANQIAIAIENSLLYREIQESAKRDSLLGIYNRKYLLDFIENKIKNNFEEKFAIVMMDIDDFKKINDNYGHLFGDEVLLSTVNLIQNSVGEEAMVGRYGGEEIIIYIGNIEERNFAFKKIEDLRKIIENNNIKLDDKEKRITASFGISYYPEDGDNIEKLLSVADNLLYEAKRSGKNKVMINKI